MIKDTRSENLLTHSPEKHVPACDQRRPLQQDEFLVPPFSEPKIGECPWIAERF